MFAVIFKARSRQLDNAYYATAAQLRQSAMDHYGCVGFESVCENGREIAISYWESLEAINHWKQDAVHRSAQQRGKAEWYRDYEVEVVEILRRYRME
ncbi:antibiotic biosynthesis monooxygenase family protein [Motiliproteus sediminis]|uniref:antibiotic biosynthesis monooxygenase family protein n=1 Tax=Motiliproteus sediminis TaxID=1468178 RepID=UPI001AEFF3EC|nr:antibiotic biosynthesis monooxygenase [Motiliproteus sediminis]